MVDERLEVRIDVDGERALSDLNRINQQFERLGQTASRSGRIAGNLFGDFEQQGEIAAGRITELVRLARQLGTTFRRANTVERFLSITADEAANAANELRDLRAAGVDTESQFRVLGQRFGLSAVEFEILSESVDSLKRNLRDAPELLARLAGSLGGSFQEAGQLAESLGLSAESALQAVSSLRQLQQANATIEEQYVALNRQLGLTPAQFDQLRASVSAFDDVARSAPDAVVRLAQALNSTFDDAIAFSTQIGLSAQESRDLIEALRALDGVGASTADSVAILGDRFGVSSEQVQTARVQLDQIEESLRDIQVVAGNTPDAVVRLAQALGSTFTASQNFAQSIGLSAQQTVEAVQAFRQLESVGASTEQQFRALNEQFQISDTDFDELTRVVRALDSLSDASPDSIIRLAQALGSTFDEAVEFSARLELTATQTREFVQELGRLDSVGASSADVVAILGARFGVTADQIELARQRISLAEESFRDLERSALNAPQAIAALGQSLNANFTEAERFAQSLGLTAEEVQRAVQIFRTLDASGASTQVQFDALNEELGISIGVFEQLADGVRDFDRRVSNAPNAVTRLAQSLGASFGEARQLAANLNLTATEAQQLIESLRQLRAANADGQQQFEALNQSLGVSGDQILVASQALDRLEEANRRVNQQTQNTPGLFVQLANALGLNFDGARQLAGSLGLTAQETLRAVQALQQLQPVTDSTERQFSLVREELGLNRAQFELLSNAIQRFNSTAINSPQAFVDLAQSLRISFNDANKLAGQLELTAETANQAIAQIQRFRAVNASNDVQFAALNRTLGINRQQFDGLNAAVGQSSGFFSNLATQARAALSPTRLLSSAFFQLAAPILGVTAAIRGLSAAYDLLIGQNDELRRETIAAAAAITSNSRVFENGIQLQNPSDAIAALDAPITAALERIRRESLDLVGVTSRELVPVFRTLAINANDIANQSERVPDSLQAASELTVGFAAALGTLGVPLAQQAQEIRTILDGTVDRNSLIAITLELTNEEINQLKEEGRLVDELNNRLQAFVEGNQLAAQTVLGISSNILEVFQEIGRVAGEPIFTALTAELQRFFELLRSNQGELVRGVGGFIELFGEFLGVIGRLFSELAEQFGPTLDVIARAIGPAFTNSIELSTNALSFLVEAFLSLSGLLAPLVNLLAEILEPLLDIGRAVVAISGSSLRDLGDLIRDFSEAVSSSISAIERFTGSTQDLTQAITELESVPDSLRPIINFLLFIAQPDITRFPAFLEATAEGFSLVADNATGAQAELDRFSANVRDQEDRSRALLATLKELNAERARTGGEPSQELIDAARAAQANIDANEGLIDSSKSLRGQNQSATKEERERAEGLRNLNEELNRQVLESGAGVTTAGRQARDLGTLFDQLQSSATNAFNAIAEATNNDEASDFAQNALDLLEQQRALGFITTEETLDGLRRIRDNQTINTRERIQALNRIRELEDLQTNRQVEALEREVLEIEALASQGAETQIRADERVTELRLEQLRIRQQAAQRQIEEERNANRIDGDRAQELIQVERQLSAEIAELEASRSEIRRRAFEQRLEVERRQQDEINALVADGILSQAQGQVELTRLQRDEVQRRLQFVREALSEEQRITGGQDSDRSRELLNEESQLQAELAGLRQEVRRAERQRILDDFDAQLQILESEFARQLESEEEFLQQRFELTDERLDAELRLIREQRERLADTDVAGLQQIAREEARILGERTRLNEEFARDIIAFRQEQFAAEQEIIANELQATAAAIEDEVNELQNSVDLLERQANLIRSQNSLIEAQTKLRESQAQVELDGIDSSIQILRQLNDESILGTSLEAELRRQLRSSGITSGLQVIDRTIRAQRIDGSNDELALLQRRAEVERQIIEEKREAQEREFQVQLQLLDIDIQRERLAAEIANNQARRAQLEAESTINAAEVEASEAQGELALATQRLNAAIAQGNPEAIADADRAVRQAESRLQLASQQVEVARESARLQGEVVEATQETLEIQDDLADRQQEILRLQQESTRAELEAAAASQERAAAVAEVRAQIEAINRAQPQENFSVAGLQSTARRAGGSMEPGKLYRVGDGPGGKLTPNTELVVPGVKSFALANRQARQLLQPPAPPRASTPNNESNFVRTMVSEIQGLRKELSRLKTYEIGKVELSNTIQSPEQRGTLQPIRSAQLQLLQNLNNLSTGLV